jgi:hypothetical protein
MMENIIFIEQLLNMTASGYRSKGAGSIPDATRFPEK